MSRAQLKVIENEGRCLFSRYLHLAEDIWLVLGRILSELGARQGELGW